MSDEWVDALEFAKRYLVRDAASKSLTVTYSNVEAQVTGHTSLRHLLAYSEDMARFLGDISRDESAAGRPLLSAVVVRADNQMPGNGFFEEFAPPGLGTAQRRVWWQARRDEVYSHWAAPPPPASAPITALELAPRPSRVELAPWPGISEPSEYVRPPVGEANPIEAGLVGRYREFRQLSELCQLRIFRADLQAPLVADIFLPQENLLIEAKSSSERGTIRTALGQVLDYARFLEPRPRLAVLLPEPPVPDLVALLAQHAIGVIYEEGEHFVHLWPKAVDPGALVPNPLAFDE